MIEVTDQTIGRAYLEAARRRLTACRDQIRHCLQQLEDRELGWRPQQSMNSIANLILHLCGNLRQWIVAGVGGSPDSRDRPREFAERGPIVKEKLLQSLEAVIGEADAVLGKLSEAQLLASRRIQGFEETVLSAIFASLSHLSGHTQEIICLTRLQRDNAYRFAWSPATPEQGAPREEVPGPETIAARDAVFAGESIATMSPELAVTEPPSTNPAGGENQSSSPLRDPLLELQQEFQEQQEEGKL